jgi:hypothetical protein
MDGVIEDICTKGVHSMSGYGPRRGFGLLGFLVGLLLLGVVAAVAYNVGVSAGAGSGGTAAAPVVYGPGWGFGGFGFGFFGFLFFILILALLFRAIFRPWGWGHHGWRGGYGPGGWGYKGTERDVPPPFEPMLESWHRRMHGEQPSEPKTGSTTESTANRPPNASPDQPG